MREVKKYDPFGYDGLSALMHEDQYGSWVHEDDFDAQSAELAEARELLRDAYSELLDMKAQIGFRANTLQVIGRIDAFLSK